MLLALHLSTKSYSVVTSCSIPAGIVCFVFIVVVLRSGVGFSSVVVVLRALKELPVYHKMLALVPTLHREHNVVYLSSHTHGHSE